MAIERIFVCDCCGATYREEPFGTGAKGWMQIQGVNLNGTDNPFFCEECVPKIMNAVDKIVDEEKS